VKIGGALIVYGGSGKVLGIELHELLVVARQVQEVDAELQSGFLEFVSATGDMVLCVITRHVNL
jgi:hypothetical protein